MNKLITYFTKNAALVNIITVFILILGALSVVRINREVFPNIGFDTIIVQTIFPGSSAESSERLITNPLEQDLMEVDGIKKMTSVSIENQSLIVLQLDSDQTTVEEAKTDIKDVIDSFADLPQGAEDPMVSSQEFKNFPIIQVSLSGDLSEHEIEENAKFLRREIQKISQVSKVSYQGLRKKEIRVESLPEKLNKNEVTLQDLVRVIQQHNVNIPGGVIEASKNSASEVIIRTIGEYRTADDIAHTVIRSNSSGQTIKIKDLAKITEGYAKEKVAQRTNAKKSIILQVLRKEGADAIDLVNSLKEKVENLESKLHPNLEVDYVNDYSYFVKRRLKVLSSNMLIGLLLVLIFLYLILPFRIAFITAFGIPFSFLGALSIFYLGDISLSLLSMMGLIIVVGMVVDDAIVVCENTQSHIEEGYSAQEAAIVGTQRIWRPVVTSVMTTIIAFTPILFMPGVFGKFVKYIPIGVIISLFVSLFECFFILPHHVAAWVKSSKENKKIRLGLLGDFWKNSITPLYLFVVKSLVHVRYLVVALALTLVLYSFNFAKNNIDFILFPSGTVDSFNIKFESKVGYPLDKMKKLMIPYENYLSNFPKDEVKNYIATIGRQGGPNLTRVKSGNQYAQITVYLTSQSDRKRSADDIIEDVRKNVVESPELMNVSYVSRRGGPPVGKAVNIGVRGSNYEDITEAVDDLKNLIGKIKGVTDIEDSYRVGKEEIHLKLKEKEAAVAGLSLREVGSAIRSAYEGIVATTLKTLDSEVDVRVTLEQKYKEGEKTLESIEIPNMRGYLVNISDVAEWDKLTGISAYEHEGNQRQVTVTSEVDSKITSSHKVNELIRMQLPELEKKNPSVSFYFGGEDRDTKESIASLVQSFGLAFLGIILILILLFKNIYQPILVAVTIPLGMVAVIWAFYFHKSPFTFLSSIGVIALSGVIVNNAIVFIDFFNRAREEGKEQLESVLISASRRIRPIFLTTITTVVGILPTAYGIGGLDPFVVPIALALGWGILGGSLLTLIFFPPSLMVLEDFMTMFRRIFRVKRS